MRGNAFPRKHPALRDRALVRSIVPRAEGVPSYEPVSAARSHIVLDMKAKKSLWQSDLLRFLEDG